MNKQHRCIKFPSETEQNNTLSFLDINITNQNNQLKVSVHRKPNFSGVFTHYEYYINQSYKKFTEEQLSVRYYITINKNFFKHTLCSKTSIFNTSKKRVTNNSTHSLNHIIKFKAKTAKFHSKFITAM